MVLILTVGFAGCQSKVTTSQANISSGLKMTTTTTSQTVTTTYLKATTTITNNKSQLNQRIRTLIDNNIECMNIFVTGTLPSNQNVPASQEMYKVTSDKFHTFEDLKKFVTDTYMKAEADHLLYNIMGEGKPLYFEKDGIFYINAKGGAGGITLYDWSKYAFQYSNINSSSKLVTVSLTEYDDNPINGTSGPGKISKKIVLENGVWKFDKMFF